MNFEQYLNLLSSLSSNILSIWGFLLTISLGIVAFLGSSKSISLPLAGVICALFLGFAFSNHIALKKNFDQRVVIVVVMESITDETFKKHLTQNRAIVNAFSIKPKIQERSLIFQIVVSVLVALLIILWPLFNIGLTRRSRKDAVNGAA